MSFLALKGLEDSNSAMSALKTKFRLFHRLVAPWILAPLLLIAITGTTYRIGRSWFGMSKETGNRILEIHTVGWFGGDISGLYLIVVGGSVLLLVFSGLWMLATSKAPKPSARLGHRILALLFFLPLALSAITGIAFRAGEQWFHIDDATKDFLMLLHQGSWLGSTLRPFYILLLFAGVLALCISGLRLLLRTGSKRGPV